MINTYSTIKDGDGNIMPDRTILFIRKTDDDGNIINFQSGNFFTPDTEGVLIIVDRYMIDQIDKVQFKNGTLSVKEGEELVTPVKSEKELKREALLRQIAELDAAKDEPAYTEEQSQLININTADYDALLTLMSIGETKANAIIDYRAEHGVFKTSEDIMKVPGIGLSLYKGLKDEIIV